MAATAEQARRQAERILSEDRFHAYEGPDPFRSLRRALGEIFDGPLNWLVDNVFRPIGKPFEYLLTPPALYFVGAGVIAIACFLAYRVVQQREARRRLHEADTVARRQPTVSARELEHQADEAEKRGDFALAVRLRYRAGLIRLARKHAIELRPSQTTRELMAIVPSRTFVPLANQFDEITYAGRPAGSEDVRYARNGWKQVLNEAGR